MRIFFTLFFLIYIIRFSALSQVSVINNPDYDNDWKNPAGGPGPVMYLTTKPTPLLPLANATSALSIPTYDLSGQPTHPGIIDFLTEQGKPTWGGYRFWMVMTPYPYFDGTKENPDLVVSNDGQHWIPAPKIKSPLYLPSKLFDNADPDMVYNTKSNELWVYFCTRGKPGSIMLIRLKENLSMEGPAMLNHMDSLISPAIWRQDTNKWHMWAISVTTQYMYHSFSPDGKNWGKFQRCFNSKKKDPFLKMGSGYKPWHVGCKPNFRERRMEFIINARDGDAMTHPSNTPYLIYAQCQMDSPTVVETPIIKPIMYYSSGMKWDNYKLYRSSFVISVQDTAYFYKIWYAGCDYSGKWGIGFVQGKLGTKFSKFPIGQTPGISIKGGHLIQPSDTLNRNWADCQNNTRSKPSGKNHFKMAGDDNHTVSDYLSNADVRIYPNPASSSLHLSIDGMLPDEEITITIMNSQGKIVNRFKWEGQEQTIDLTTYRTGLYFIQVCTMEDKRTYKVFINHSDCK